VLDFSLEAAADPDFLLGVDHVLAWQREHGPLPSGGWMLFRTGWDARSSDPVAFLNDAHTPGVTAECARYLAEETPLIGIGVETVGTDAGHAGQFDPAYPCHHYFQGANKYGLTQLRNLGSLPPRGAVLIAGPLPITGGSGSPARVLALVERATDAGHDY
jgi:kynurenine formamidase